jgi:hypothetical protein
MPVSDNRGATAAKKQRRLCGGRRCDDKGERWRWRWSERWRAITSSNDLEDMLREVRRRRNGGDALLGGTPVAGREVSSVLMPLAESGRSPPCRRTDDDARRTDAHRTPSFISRSRPLLSNIMLNSAAAHRSWILPSSDLIAHRRRPT